MSINMITKSMFMSIYTYCHEIYMDAQNLDRDYAKKVNYYTMCNRNRMDRGK